MILYTYYSVRVFALLCLCTCGATALHLIPVKNRGCELGALLPSRAPGELTALRGSTDSINGPAASHCCCRCHTAHSNVN